MTSKYMYAQVITTVKDQKVQANSEELRLLASDGNACGPFAEPDPAILQQSPYEHSAKR